jgi:hypothetical protein
MAYPEVLLSKNRQATPSWPCRDHNFINPPSCPASVFQLQRKGQA